MNPLQGTVGGPIEIVGVGLHSGKLVRIKLLPAPPNHGITFQREDIPGSRPILAHPQSIVSTNLCTTIGEENAKIATVEHLMAALYGLGIDNASVLVDGEELPILDGSSAPFVDRLLDAGVQRQPEKRHLISFDHEIFIGTQDQFVRYLPWPKEAAKPQQTDRLVIHCMIDFSRSKAIGIQNLSWEFQERSFMDISEARTFCHIQDVEAMRSKGLANGGSLDNAVVVNDHKVLNNDGLRYTDEFVRHKILDCLGDLALIGGRLVGQLFLKKSGHKLHGEFTSQVVKLLEQRKTSNPALSVMACLASGTK